MISFLFLDYKHNFIRENIDSEPGVSWTIPSVLNLKNPKIQPRKYLYTFFFKLTEELCPDRHTWSILLRQNCV